MNPAATLERIPDLSLGTAALIIFAAIAALALLRGLLRILWAVVMLSLAALAALFAWRHAPAIGRSWFEPLPDWFSPTLTAASFVLALIALRFLGRLLAETTRQPGLPAGETRRSPAHRALTLLFSLIPAALLCLTAGAVIHQAGGVAELRAFGEKVARQPTPDHTAFLARLRRGLDQSLPGWIGGEARGSDELRLRLAKLITWLDRNPPRAIPVLEEHQIRELVLADPELRRLAREGRYGEILRDPRLDRLLENDNLREVLANLDL